MSAASEVHGWRLLRSGPGAPAWNMAVDEALLSSDDPRPVLRLYAWDPPALSLGWFQPRQAFVATAAAAGLLLVRRPTGGGAIHHDDELTFCVVATPGADGYPADVLEAYERVHEVLRRALARCGAVLHARGGGAPLSVHPRAATLCFADGTAHDLVDAQGRKVVGSAQRRRDGRVLHHGSIPLTTPALTPDAGSLRLVAGRRVSWHEAARAVAEAFREALPGGGWEEGGLSGAERRAAQALLRRPLADAGVSPA